MTCHYCWNNGHNKRTCLERKRDMACYALMSAEQVAESANRLWRWWMIHAVYAKPIRPFGMADTSIDWGSQSVLHIRKLAR